MSRSGTLPTWSSNDGRWQAAGAAPGDHTPQSTRDRQGQEGPHWGTVSAMGSTGGAAAGTRKRDTHRDPIQLGANGRGPGLPTEQIPEDTVAAGRTQRGARPGQSAGLPCGVRRPGRPPRAIRVVTQARQSPLPSLALRQEPATEARSRAGALPRPAPSYLLRRGRGRPVTPGGSSPVSRRSCIC